MAPCCRLCKFYFENLANPGEKFLMSMELLDADTWTTWEETSTTSSTSCLTRPDHLYVLILVV